MERDGQLASPRAVDDAPDAAEVEEESQPAADAASQTSPTPGTRTLTPDEMVGDLRTKIERMGAVNMMAIDQFDDLESRHTFLTAQRRDLVDSIAATNEAIRRIDKTTRERFQEAFTVINQYFEQTFTTLFGGGRAGLVLLDESDALESGIDIIAQPPGKRLQSVQLLSGGEKALTAMALMFAIFRYRPSPFCLLDEIDAPLDDANIGRFVEMLQGMQDAHAVHPDHAQSQDDGDRRSSVRRDDGGAWRVETDLRSVELMNEDRASRYHRLRRRTVLASTAAGGGWLFWLLYSGLAVETRALGRPPRILAARPVAPCAVDRPFRRPPRNRLRGGHAAVLAVSLVRARTALRPVVGAAVGLVEGSCQSGGDWPAHDNWRGGADCAVDVSLQGVVVVARCGDLRAGGSAHRQARADRRDAALLPVSAARSRSAARSAADALASGQACAVLGAFEWGLGDKTTRANAALVGVGRTRRILVSDTLLKDFTDDEIEVILAHEIAHHVHRDIWSALAVESAIMLLSLLGAAPRGRPLARRVRHRQYRPSWPRCR